MHRLYKLSCEMSIGYILEEEKAMHMWNCMGFLIFANLDLVFEKCFKYVIIICEHQSGKKGKLRI